MRMPRVAALPLSVRATVGLLLVGAFLVVLGLFNQYLAWDIFSPHLEKVLWGVFGSSIALGAFGVAITLVLGIQEIALALARGSASAGATTPAKPAPRGRAYVIWLGVVFGFLVMLVAGLDRLNGRISGRRTAVFKQLAVTEVTKHAPSLLAALARANVCAGCRSPELAELLAALRRQSFVAEATLYLAAGGGNEQLWRYGSREAWQKEDSGFEGVVVSTDLERAIALALHGDGAWIAQKNAGADFTWNAVLEQPGGSRALLRVVGNPRESYR